MRLSKITRDSRCVSLDHNNAQLGISVEAYKLKTDKRTLIMKGASLSFPHPSLQNSLDGASGDGCQLCLSLFFFSKLTDNSGCSRYADSSHFVIRVSEPVSNTVSQHFQHHGDIFNPLQSIDRRVTSSSWNVVMDQTHLVAWVHYERTTRVKD